MFHDLEKGASECISTQQISKEGFASVIEPNSTHPVLLSVTVDTSVTIYKPSPNLRKVLRKISSNIVPRKMALRKT